jgi:hypothetical protein
MGAKEFCRMRTSLIVIAAVALQSCRAAAPDPRIAALEKKVAEVQTANEELKNAKDAIELRVNMLEEDMINALRPRSAVFDPVHKEFQPIHTDLGVFLVSLRDISPYANGYKVRFNLGNPMQVNFVGVELELRWGPKRPSDFKTIKFSDWNAQFKTSKQSLTQTLRAGAWNPVEVIIAPATAEQIGQIEINGITTKTVSLSAR